MANKNIIGRCAFCNEWIEQLSEASILYKMPYPGKVLTNLKNGKSFMDAKPEVLGYRHNDCKLMGKPVNSRNFIGHYTTWCHRNGYPIMSYEVLAFVFEGCDSDEEFANTFEALILAQESGFFMQPQQISDKDALENLIMKLKLRIELFRRVPTGTNMILAYQLIEDITLKVFKESQIDMDDRLINKFDGCKNLALGTKYIHERKLAFDKSFGIFLKLIKRDAL